MKDEDDSVDGAEEEADEQAEELSDDESSSTEDASDEVAEADGPDAEAKDADAPVSEKPAPRKKKKKKKKKKKRASREREAVDADERETPLPSAARAPVKRPAISTLGYGLALATLVVGAGAGWFLRDARAAEVDVAPEGNAATAGSAGPCGDWQGQICSGAGDTSAACGQAKAASGIMPDKACVAAIPEVAQTLADLKVKRASCDKLEAKLCEDLGAESAQCKMVKSKTSSIPTDKCQELFDNYDKVLASLKQAPGARPGMPPGMRPGGPPGMRPGMRPGGPPGGPPGGAPKVKVVPAPPPKAP